MSERKTTAKSTAEKASSEVTPSPRKKRTKPARPTAREKIFIAERQELVYRLYKMGASIRQISQGLKDAGYKNCSKSNIWKDLQAAIESAQKMRDISRDAMLTVLIDNAWSLFGTFASKAHKERDVQAGRVARDLNNDLDRLMNISRNTQAETEANVVLAKILGVDPEAIADGVDSE